MSFEAVVTSLIISVLPDLLYPQEVAHIPKESTGALVHGARYGIITEHMKSFGNGQGKLYVIKLLACHEQVFNI